MINAEIKKRLMEDLNKLPVESQKRVKDFAHALLISQTKGIKGKDLLKFANTIGKEEADLMLKAIDEGCGKVDLSEW